MVRTAPATTPAAASASQTSPERMPPSASHSTASKAARFCTRPWLRAKLHAELAMARALLAHDLNVNDAMAVLESSLGYRLKNTHIEAGAVAAGKMRARLLDVAETAPLLRIRFTPYDVSDTPLVYAEMFFRADRFNDRAVVKR